MYENYCRCPGCGECDAHQAARESAKPINGVVVLREDNLPSGIKVLIVPCGGVDEYEKMPQVVKYNNNVFGRTGYDSDKLVAFYRSDAKVAFSVV
jgi:hypothetical protein